MCKEELYNELNNKYYINIQTDEKLDLEKVSKLKDNAMLKVRPELWIEWDFEKNSELGFDIWKMTKGSNKKVWWNCRKCGSSFDTEIKERQKSKCPYCSGKRVNHTNSLASLNPELAKQWHPIKNKKTPHNVTCGSKQYVWWIGECGHEWINNVYKRNFGEDCPYCSGHQTLIGFNDMWTTNPELARKLANSEDGFRYRQYSSKYTNWKCPDCGEMIKNKKISDVNTYGLSCPKCSDGVSYPEKLMYSLLRELDIDFIKELSSKDFKCSNDKRYDFYIPSLNIIVETHGEQHFKKGFSSTGGQSLEEVRTNDQYKYELAIINSIKPENYIVIDCRKSDFEFIKDNIMNSRLAEVFDLDSVDWEKVFVNSEKSLVKLIWDEWNKGFYSTFEISKKYRLSQCTVIRYLNRGKRLNKCTYSKDISIKNLSSKRQRVVIQMNYYNEVLNEYVSIKDAAENVNAKSSSQIIKSCKNDKYTAYGYKWMYKEDYEKYIEEQSKLA